jgi:hypothetical protein
MKTLRFTLIGAAALAFAGVTLAAPTDIILTGSTAYRANVYRSIQAVLTSTYGGAGYTVAFSGSTNNQAGLEGSQFAVFNSADGTVRIKTSWTGSEAGVQAVSRNDIFTVAVYPDSQATGTLGTTSPFGLAAPTNLEPAVIDMADTSQAASAFNGSYKGKNYPALTDDTNSPVGIVPFKFIASPGAAAAGLTNITSQLFRSLLTNGGTVPLSLFTGVPADASTTVFVTGRNPDSGTRVTAYTETGFGIVNLPTQYQPQNSANAEIDTAGGTIDHFALWPRSTVNTIVFPTGQGGYNSGGNLSKGVNNTPPANTLLVSYAGTNDCDPQITAGETELSFNGQKLGGVSADYNSNHELTQGQYSFWGYEHLYYNSSATAAVISFADAVGLDLKNNNAVVFRSSMSVGRSGFVDGATIVPGGL